MTVSTTTARNVKSPNGSTTSFPFDFSFDADTELLVTRVVIATAVEIPQALTTDYTVTGGSGATGTIEMNVAPPGPALENLVIERVTPKTQSTDYQPNDPFPAEVNETALDRLTRISQEGLDLVNRSVKLKKNSILAGPTIPDPEVDKVLVGKTSTEFQNKKISDIDPAVTPLPLSIANGGTNAATAAAARINLDTDWTVAAKAAAYTIVATDNRSLIAASAFTSYTVSLPAASAAGNDFIVSIIKTDGSPNTITVDPAGIDLINGATTLVLRQRYDAVLLISDGTSNWFNLFADVDVGDNVVINPNFDVWQRGTTFTAVTDDDYGPDRYQWEQGGAGVVDLLQSTSVPDDLSDFSLQVDVTTADASLAAGDIYLVTYKVEGYDAMRFGFGTSDATTLTLSFWVRSAKTGIHCVAFRNSAQNRSYVVEYTIAAADTWEFQTVTLTADVTGTWGTSSGIGLQISWAIALGSTFHTAADTWTAGNFLSTSGQVNVMDSAANNFHLSRIQLEIGGVATAFERRAFQQELALCQRYARVWGPVASEHICITANLTTTLAEGHLPLVVEMRVTPTLTISAAADFDMLDSASARQAVSALTLNTDSSNKAAVLDITSSGLFADGASSLRHDAAGNGKLILDAEL